MALDPKNLSATHLVRLLNSTPLGAVVSAAKVHRQLDEAGLRICAPGGDGKRIHLVRYVAWLAREREKPQAQPSTYKDKLRATCSVSWNGRGRAGTSGPSRRW